MRIANNDVSNTPIYTLSIFMKLSIYLQCTKSHHSLKKTLLSILLTTVVSLATAQEIQLLYDFGEVRQMPYTMIQKYNYDQLGSTYFFVSMGYNTREDGITLAYWEMSRSFNTGDWLLSPRVEYNGGLYTYDGIGEVIKSAWLAGVEKTWSSDDYSKLFGLSLNYKYIKNISNASYQITGTWGINLFDKKFSFVGYADIWRQHTELYDREGMLQHADFVFVSEPQLWYNINKTFSVVAELELNCNYDAAGFYVCPALGLRWNMESKK